MRTITTRREWIRQAAGASALAGLPTLLSAQNPASAPADEKKTIIGGGSLKAHAAVRGLLTGCAVNANLFREDEGFRKLLIDQYSILVPENCLKWNILRPTPDTYSFADADSLVAFAETNQMKVRGHNFVWHEALPKWFAGTVTKENAQKFLVDHIRTVGGRGERGDLDTGRTTGWIEKLFAVVSDARPGLHRSRLQHSAPGGPQRSAHLQRLQH